MDVLQGWAVYSNALISNCGKSTSSLPSISAVCHEWHAPIFVYIDGENKYGERKVLMNQSLK